MLSKGFDIRNLIIKKGNSFNKKWDVFHSKAGEELVGSFQTEVIELEKYGE